MKHKKKIIFFVIIAILVFFFIKSGDSQPGKYDNFAQCLTDNKAVFYGSFQCIHCQNQKELFGGSMKKINYIECGPLNQPPNTVCLKAGVEAYPTWFIGEAKYTGVQSLERLSNLTNCELPN